MDANGDGEHAGRREGGGRPGELLPVPSEIREGVPDAVVAIRLPLTASGVKHGLSASIGVALGQSDPDALLSNADAAVYRAKAAGRGGIAVFRERRGVQ